MESNSLLIIIGSCFILLGVTGRILIEKLAIDLPLVLSRIIISLVGVILLVIGIIGHQNLVPLRKSTSSDPVKAQIDKHYPEPEKQGKRNLPGNRAIKNQLGSVTITQPTSGDSVSDDLDVSGTYSDDISDDLWVFVWPEKSPHRGYPQSNDAAAGAPAFKENRQWSVHCYFGGPPQRYEIAIYTATHSASQFLGNKLKVWYESNDYKGISTPDLPDGLMERQRIHVVKQ